MYRGCKGSTEALRWRAKKSGAKPLRPCEIPLLKPRARGKEADGRAMQGTIGGNRISNALWKKKEGHKNKKRRERE